MTTNDRNTALQADGGPSPCASHDMAPRPPFRGAGDAPPPLPAPATWAFFLDLDGTLLDLAARPDAVSPEGGLAGMLVRLERMVSGALALVTGRAVEFVDELFPEQRFTVAGLHGAELRPSPSLAGHLLPPPPGTGDAAAFRAAQDLARDRALPLPGVLFEDKGRAFALHYRQAPEQRDAVARIMAEALALAGTGHRLRDGKCVVELGPAGQDKGMIVRNLMGSAPFQGRYPVAAGDDLTDEAMFRAVNALGGLSVRVGPEEALARSAASTGIETPGAFRSWLRGMTG
ncbi:trehalose-phosphatase [Paracoccus aminovorans]|nr:trehalose-phosphatase [Paracoccus aminovorans]